jgi:PAS domain-containing protein
MRNQDKPVNEATLLRLIAEDHLKNEIPIYSQVNEFDHLKLIHELQVHQIELEMQNEELIKAQQQTVLMTEKYLELYDFAPCGYVTLSKEGDIVDLNFSAAKMLGRNRIELRNTRFGLHISHDSLRDFNQLLDRSFMLREKESCELILLHKTDKVDKSMCVHVDAQVTKDNSKCMFTMIDISELKKLESELNKTVKLLREHNLL